jgi:hypothetical protein
MDLALFNKLYPNWVGYATMDILGGIYITKYTCVLYLNSINIGNIYETFDYVRGFLLANNFDERSNDFIYKSNGLFIIVKIINGQYYLSRIVAHKTNGHYCANELIITIKNILEIDDSMNKLVNS